MTVTETAPHTAVRRHVDVMGTVASVHVHDDVDRKIVDAAILSTFAELHRLEAMFSTFRETSEISQVNAGRRSLLDCSPEVIDVLDACTWLEHASDGAFCVRHDGRIDPAGFVKGWAAERAAAQLRDHGLAHWCLSVGGDLLVSGSPGSTGGPWNIAIADPLVAGGVMTAVPMHSGAIATSGTAARGRHLWDATGAPADTFASVTVVGPSLTWADAFATTACAIGAGGLDWVSQFDDYRAFAITHARELIGTPSA